MIFNNPIVLGLYEAFTGFHAQKYIFYLLSIPFTQLVYFVYLFGKCFISRQLVLIVLKSCQKKEFCNDTVIHRLLLLCLIIF